MRRFGLKTDMDFANFSVDSDMVFEGITVVTINVFIASIPNEQGRKRKMRIRSGFEEIFFGCCSNLSNYDIIS